MENDPIINKNLSTDDLRKEGLIISHYLIKSDPPTELITHYVTANQTLLSSSKLDPDRHLICRLLQYPRILPFIDAYSGVFKPKNLLRKKMLIMLSILETAPEFTESFRPISFSRIQFITNLFFCLFIKTLIPQPFRTRC